MSFEMGPNAQKKKLELKYRLRKCLFLYHYWMHPLFGFMSARLQTWFPFQVQIYNGREWLARQMTGAGILYVRQENCFRGSETIGRFRRWGGVAKAVSAFARTRDAALRSADVMRFLGLSLTAQGQVPGRQLDELLLKKQRNESLVVRIHADSNRSGAENEYPAGEQACAPVTKGTWVAAQSQYNKEKSDGSNKQREG
jgi:hypothetical protein